MLDQPNLIPPITTTDQALEYKATLEKIDPETEFLMTLYLSPDLTPDEIRKAKAAGIVGTSSATNSSLCSHVHLGVKSYPRGVTTNSDGGIESYEAYYPVFETMQEVDMVLNLHGEVPSDISAVGLEFHIASHADLGAEHPYNKRRANLSTPPKETPCTLPTAPYSSRACYDSCSSGNCHVLGYNSCLHDNRPPPCTHR